MSRVIVNASPVIGLSMIGKLYLLWRLFDEVYIPTAVINELRKYLMLYQFYLINSNSSSSEVEMTRHFDFAQCP